ncbi:hypothetical protein ACVWW6_005547 [Bradyrhizobium sp. USDA 3311]
MNDGKLVGAGMNNPAAVAIISPTVGRNVHYRVASEANANGMTIYNTAQPMVALVTYVHSDSCVNLVVFDHCGNAHPRTSVPINNVWEGASAWAEWMPYQKGQAAKTEAAESALKAGSPA